MLKGRQLAQRVRDKARKFAGHAAVVVAMTGLCASAYWVDEARTLDPAEEQAKVAQLYQAAGEYAAFQTEFYRRHQRFAADKEVGEDLRERLEGYEEDYLDGNFDLYMTGGWGATRREALAVLRHNLREESQGPADRYGERPYKDEAEMSLRLTPARQPGQVKLELSCETPPTWAACGQLRQQVLRLGIPVQDGQRETDVTVGYKPSGNG